MPGTTKRARRAIRSRQQDRAKASIKCTVTVITASPPCACQASADPSPGLNSSSTPSHACPRPARSSSATCSTPCSRNTTDRRPQQHPDPSQPLPERQNSANEGQEGPGSHPHSPKAEPVAALSTLPATRPTGPDHPVPQGSQTTRDQRHDCIDRSTPYTQPSGTRISANPLNSPKGHFRPKRISRPLQYHTSRKRGVGCAGCNSLQCTDPGIGPD